MQTRSTRNLKRVQMMDLIIDDPDATGRRHTTTIRRPNVPPKKRERVEQVEPVPPKIIDQRISHVASVPLVAPIASVAPLVAPVPCVLPVSAPFQSLSDVLRSTIYSPSNGTESAWHSLAANSKPETYLVLDTESYQIQSELGTKSVVPLQVAWGVYKWNPNSLRLDLITKATCYVTEIMCIGRFRDAIKKVSERNYLKHEANMKSNGYPLLSVKDLLKVLHDTISQHGVATIVGYNLSWDFEALRNLMSLFSVEHPSFDVRCDNPFNPLKLRHVDLMHEMIKKYGKRLVESGIKDGSVHKDAHKTWLRKNVKYSKTIYSAEYVLQSLFGISQQHLADNDVEHEALMLERVIQEFGESALEHGVLYPQRTSYEFMVRIANEALSNDVTETEEQAIRILSRIKVPAAATSNESVLARQPTPHPSCLFLPD